MADEPSSLLLTQGIEPTPHPAYNQNNSSAPSLPLSWDDIHCNPCELKK
jgi:hypothetical protein